MSWLTSVASNIAVGACLALLAWWAQRRLNRPAIAHSLWILVLVKLVTPPLVSIPIFESALSESCRLGFCGCPQHARSGVIDSLSWFLLAVWFLGAIATGATAIHRWYRLRVLLRNAEPAAASWHALAERLASEISLSRVPKILVVPGLLPPMVIPGWGQPRLLIPQELLSRLSEGQRAVMILHELVHIQRRDHWVRILELLVRTIYWWLPILGVVGRQLRASEELCCDEAVVSRRPDSRRDYACLLLDVVDFVSLPPRLVEHVTAINPAADLERRLRAILGSSAGQKGSWRTALLVLLLAGGVMPWGVRSDGSGRSGPARGKVESIPAAFEKREPTGEPILRFSTDLRCAS